MADTKSKSTKSAPVKEADLKKEIKKEAKTFTQKLKDEPLVAVYGPKSFQATLGNFYTFLLNTYPVTIRFDGTYQKFPKSIAEKLQKKLDNISVAVSPVNKEVKL